MELAEFVEGSLVEIATGVRGANSKLKEAFGWRENPFVLQTRGMTTDGKSYVEFDVAVTAASSEGTTGGGGLQIAVLRAGLESSDRRSEERVTRIRFQVTISTEVE